MIVLDASAGVDIVRGTPEGIAYLQSLEPDEKIVSCDLYQTEVASAFWRYVHASLVGEDEARNRMLKAIELVDEFFATGQLVREAFRAAVRYDHSPYDMFYFVLARRLGATLFTSDKGLISLCEKNGEVDCVHNVDFSL